MKIQENHHVEKRRTTQHRSTTQLEKKKLYVSGSCQKDLTFVLSFSIVSTAGKRENTTDSLIINFKTVVNVISILKNTKHEVLCCRYSCHLRLCCCLLWIFVSCSELFILSLILGTSRCLRRREVMLWWRDPII